LTYNPADDARKSYDAAIEAKRQRGDAHDWEGRPWKRMERIGDCTLYLGDCLGVLPALGRVDAVVTDPPYGIAMARGVRGGGVDGFGKGVKRTPKHYTGDWDKDRPGKELFEALLAVSDAHIIWGGNYFADLLPMSQKWLWWDKLQTMPSYSDGELAWTSLPGASTKKFVYNGSGLMAREKERQHPTQKPVELLRWCLGFLPNAGLICDPFMGSGTTGVACAKLGRRFIGVEVDEGYFEIACERIRMAYAQPDMFVEARAPEPKQEAML
jgi:DNA modification methylase